MIVNGFHLSGIGDKAVNGVRLSGVGDGEVVNGVRVNGFSVNGVQPLNILALTVLRLYGVRLMDVSSFCGSKTQNSLFKVLRRRTELAKQAKTQGKPRFIRILRFCLCVMGFREKITRRPTELIKFPMPAARHENKKNLAMILLGLHSGPGSSSSVASWFRLILDQNAL